MLTRWYDIDREAAAFDTLLERMYRFFDTGRTEGSAWVSGTWPLVNLYDSGTNLVAYVELPGVAPEELEIQAQGDVLTISGTRTIQPPEGYKVHRIERGSRRFSRSFGLPSRVDPELTKATLKNGVLTITMEKHPEAQPKKITVSTS